jgi:uncharacterized protein YPO0396
VKYYKAVSQFINTNNLKGRIVYHRFEDTSSLRGFQISPANCMLQKIEFNEKSPYWKWVEDMIFDHYNYACVSSLEEFYNYKEKGRKIENI